MSKKQVSIPLERYEELLRKEYMANSILMNDYLNIEHVKWAVQNYKDSERIQR